MGTPIIVNRELAFLLTLHITCSVKTMLGALSDLYLTRYLSGTDAVTYPVNEPLTVYPED